MVANGGLGAGQLQVDLAVMELDVRADQIGDHVDHWRRTHDIGEGRRNIRWVVDPAQGRMIGRMIGADIEARPPVDGRGAEGGVMLPALLDPAAKLAAHGVELLGRHRIFDHQVAVAAVSVLICFAQHGLAPLLGFGAPSQARYARTLASRSRGLIGLAT